MRGGASSRQSSCYQLPIVEGIDFEGVKGCALIDTGSTTSGIRSTIARKLDLPRRGKRPMGGVGGEVQLERIIIRIALPAMEDAPSFPFVFDDVIGMELFDSFSFDALLGMDILGKCDLHVLRSGVATLAYG